MWESAWVAKFLDLFWGTLHEGKEFVVKLVLANN